MMNKVYFDVSAYGCAFNNNTSDYSCACIDLKKTPFSLATSFETFGWLGNSKQPKKTDQMVKNFGKGSQGGIAPKDNTHVSTDGSARFNWQYMNQVMLKVNFINWFKGTDGLTQIEKALMTMIQEEKTRIL